MVFSSSVFIFTFLPIIIILNLILPAKARNIVLLCASLIFYAWGEPLFVFLMLVSIFVNYMMALRISDTEETKKRRNYLILAVVVNLLFLMVFKYTNFITTNLFGLTGIGVKPTTIPLPIGISFFTFQAMSYVIDVYRNNAKAEKNLFNVALYISFFPQLIAGPIIKYHDISHQIKKRYMTTDKIYNGLSRFIVGLAKKLLIANTLGEAADIIFKNDPTQLGTMTVWIGAITYTLQIYFDFSGYSDMAIGLGKIFGFDYKENFNYPLIAANMNDFWKRWHMSLTNWFREYLYFPLGGNRKGPVRTYMNLIIVFFCTGFWHGAEWTFIIWGLIHGLFMLLEKASIIKFTVKRLRYLGSIYTLLVVITTFTIFRAPSISYAFDYIKGMFTFNNILIRSNLVYPLVYSPMNILIFVVAIFASIPILQRIKNKVSTASYDKIRFIGNLALFILCLLTLAGESFNPFIYFRF